MNQEITVPSVGESITSGLLSAWAKGDGDYVNEGETLFELETDKSLIEVPAPASGTLTILVQEGTEVEIGQVVAQLAVGQGATAPAAAPTPEKETPAAQTEPALSPAVRKVVADHGLDPAAIEGTGKGGRITKADALRAIKEQVTAVAATIAAVATPKPQSVPPASPKPAPVVKPVVPQGERAVERVPMSRLRRTTAERLVQAKQSTAYLTTFNEIDMHNVMAMRSRYKASFEKDHGVRLGFMSFFVKACCQALKAFPAVNAQLEGSDVLYHHYCDIGVAVSFEGGLIVPIIRSAEQLGFAEIESTIVALAERAREKKILPDELTGGTFSITNGGVFGSLQSTPIPAYPQTAILGMHAIKKRPVVVDDQIVIRPMMYVALTYDHRVIDGREAVSFLARVRDFVEEPEKLLLEM
ncbi:2-oxoglutarate dehydrogenase complex dihydrolipoyllysine-residue succinyltransferase [Planctomycetota bacterium]